MKMRPLIIDDNARAEVARVVAHAETHHYRRGESTPGDDPAFVAHLNTYRCVFTYTDHEGILWRHLSISVPGDKYPNPIAAFTIAELFGFTGWNGVAAATEDMPEDWVVSLDKIDHVVIMGQPIRTTVKLVS